MPFGCVYMTLTKEKMVDILSRPLTYVSYLVVVYTHICNF